MAQRLTDLHIHVPRVVKAWLRAKATEARPRVTLAAVARSILERAMKEDVR